MKFAFAQDLRPLGRGYCWALSTPNSLVYPAGNQGGIVFLLDFQASHMYIYIYVYIYSWYVLYFFTFIYLHLPQRAFIFCPLEKKQVLSCRGGFSAPGRKLQFARSGSIWAQKACLSVWHTPTCAHHAFEAPPPVPIAAVEVQNRHAPSPATWSRFSRMFFFARSKWTFRIAAMMC